MRRRLLHNPLLLAGGVIVVLMVAVTLLAPFLSPFDPTEPTDAPRLEAPRPPHYMGTDQLQRDVFSRVLHGGRIPILVALTSVAVSLTTGTLLGWIAGFAGGRVDRVLSLLMDAIYSFPALILAIAIVAVLGPGLVNMTAAIAFVYIPAYFRVARAQVLVIREQEFVEAAQAIGASRTRTRPALSSPVPRISVKKFPPPPPQQKALRAFRRISTSSTPGMALRISRGGP